MSCGQPYVICNEEESTKCSSQATNLGYDDHNEYFGIKNYIVNHECIPSGKACS